MPRKIKHDLPSRVYFAEQLQRFQHRTGMTYREIADAADLDSENHLSNLKGGASKISLHTLPALCRVIYPELDLVELTLMRLKEEHPDAWGTLEQSLIEILLPSEAEDSLLSAINAALERNRLPLLGPITSPKQHAEVERFVLQMTGLQHSDE